MCRSYNNPLHLLFDGAFRQRRSLLYDNEDEDNDGDDDDDYQDSRSHVGTSTTSSRSRSDDDPRDNNYLEETEIGGTSSNTLTEASVSNQVFMADGNTKRIKNIQPGDTVLEPDRLPRRVIGISAGRSHLVEVHELTAHINHLPHDYMGLITFSCSPGQVYI
ncbi:MAG: hypothetical protein BYD32DRAFT_449604 [Podila humilis]|nr:MAG: hypothetical protein BYD32DRAFT_449604 [Podila humilis]